MRRQDLEYQYPESLVATEPQTPSRIALSEGLKPPQEINKSQLLEMFKPGDVLVLNDTQVEKRRVFAGELEILFVKALSDLKCEVLLPARDLKVGDQVTLPGDVTLTLLAKGLPQQVQVSEALGAKYFAQYGEPALPPYIQKARGECHARQEDQAWYQSKWARELGSAAAPTASLHFSTEDLEILKARGVRVHELTLHVGLGTFLPIKTEQLSDHVMHQELAYISLATQNAILQAKKENGHVWALGTTVTRALESWGQGLLPVTESGAVCGETSLFIQPGYQFKIVTDLLTNFHQPGSTLLALVSGFAGLERVKQIYQWAIENKFRLFSYGDLSVWRLR